MIGYYDYVLGLVPLTLLGITATLTLAGVEPTTAVPLASLVAVSVIGHALFVNGPVARVPDAPAMDSSTGPLNAD